MFYQTVTLAVIGMFYALAAFEEPPSYTEEKMISCSCKKKKKNALIACEGHDEPLEEELPSNKRLFHTS